MRRFLAALAITSLIATPALATPCRDAKGKFAKCQPAKAAKKAPCRDAKGKFTKCPK